MGHSIEYVRSSVLDSYNRKTSLGLATAFLEESARADEPMARCEVGWRCVKGVLLSDPESPDITGILEKAGCGDPHAAEDLLPLVYQQLRAAAQKQMAQERGDHTLQATALVHEAYVRLVGPHDVPWENRAHFYVAR